MKRIATLGAAAILITGCLNGTSALADDTPNPADPTAVPTSTPPVQVDPHAPGLKLLQGATLAQPKVLDIETVVDDPNGDERQTNTPTDVTFSLQSEVLFPKDSANLGTDANSRLQEIADEIIKDKPQYVRVFGFTDNLGTHEHGVVLSRQRAQAVYTVLVQDLGSDGGSIQFDVRGYAEQYPVADNSTEGGRRENRRVEITFPTTDGGGAG